MDNLLTKCHNLIKLRPPRQYELGDTDGLEFKKSFGDILRRSEECSPYRAVMGRQTRPQGPGQPMVSHTGECRGFPVHLGIVFDRRASFMPGVLALGQ